MIEQRKKNSTFHSNKANLNGITKNQSYESKIRRRILTMLRRKIKTIKGNNELSNKRLPTLSILKVSTEAFKRKGK